MRRPGTRLLLDVTLAMAAIAGLVVLGTRETSAPGVEVERLDPPAAVDRVVAHIAGAVATPGTVTLPRGARVADAVTAVGGAVPEGDLDAINLARRIDDGERILVPRKGDSTARLLDLNRATRSQLVALPEIGEVTADKIIASRAEAPFRSSDDLVSRRLLSTKEYEAVRNLVTASP
ncbi:MAG: competence protein ComEA [Dehalococcoidia bacterium]|nr:MAG: competence protein ComEA [Dehalococcoidia bacterium]